MKIRTKMSLLSALFLIVMIATITGVIAYNIISNTRPEIKRYRVDEMTRIKQELKDKVDMVYELVDAEYRAMTSKETVEKHFGRRVKNVIESTESLLSDYQARVEAGKISLKEAQKQAKARIAQIRYDGNVGYIWINDTTAPHPSMIMHPTSPDLDGKVLDSRRWETAKGDTKNLFAAAVKLTSEKGRGFIEYEWPKPTNDGKLTEMQPKVSYVSLFEPWGWILGTGVYIDDVQAYSLDKVKETVASLRYDNKEGYFFIISNETPYPINIMNPIAPELNGKRMDNPQWERLAKNKSKHLFRALVDEVRYPSNGGFVDYVWKKPVGDGTTNEFVPKVSYVRGFEPLNWIIGSGVYTDDIEQAIVAKETAMNDRLKRLITTIIIVAILFLLLSLISSYLFASGLSKGLEELTKVAREISLGKGLDEQIDSTKRNDEIGQLARAVERLQTSVKMMLERMKK